MTHTATGKRKAKMAKAEDLTGREFEYLKVIERAQDHVTKSGQKKVQWMCECRLCGKKINVLAQDLKRGRTKSCGCLQAYKGKAQRHKRKCVICGKMFECPPSGNNATCSKECSRKYASVRLMGHRVTDETREKISEKAKGRDMAELQKVATEAAKKSPNSGRFETNVNAIDWHLVSPDGKDYYFHSLRNWLRENGKELFGIEPDTKEFNNTASGLNNAKRAMMGGSYNCTTYKGWRVIPTKSDTK